MEIHWQKAIRNFHNGSTRPAILGIGSPLRGDDGVGVDCAEKIERAIQGKKKKSCVKVFIGETAPENITSEIIRANPDTLLIIDALDSNKDPGSIVFISPLGETDGISASTHRMPIHVLCSYLRKSIDCRIALLGIVPQSCEFGETIGKAVRKASASLVKEILNSL
jgi:hydrogenase maturation protease HycI